MNKRISDEQLDSLVAAIGTLQEAGIGRLQPGRIGPMTFEAMRQEYAATIKGTLEEFGGDTESYVHGVFLDGANVKAAITGISPNSGTLAFVLAAAINAVLDLQDCREALKAVEKERDELSAFQPAFTNQLKDLGFDARMVDEYREQKMTIRSLRERVRELEEALRLDHQRTVEAVNKIAEQILNHPESE